MMSTLWKSLPKCPVSQLGGISPIILLNDNELITFTVDGVYKYIISQQKWINFLSKPADYRYSAPPCWDKINNILCVYVNGKMASYNLQN